MKATKKTTAGKKPKGKAHEANRMRALLVRVNRIRLEVREIAKDPDLQRVMNVTDYDQFTPYDVGCIDLTLHQIADGAALAYSQLMGK